MKNRYSFNLFWSEEDGEYVATCPAFPRLSALGPTPESALAEARVALELFVQEFKARGWKLPEREGQLQYSGQFRVRLSKSLHAQAARAAAREGVSLNQFVQGAVEAKVATIELGEKVIERIEGILASSPRRQKLARRTS